MQVRHQIDQCGAILQQLGDNLRILISNLEMNKQNCSKKDKMTILGGDQIQEREEMQAWCHPPVQPQLTFQRGAAAAFRQSIYF